MRRVMIIGCGGAGKSTLATKLAEITELPLYHLDKLFWAPNWKILPEDVWKEKQTHLCEKESWIIDGNYRFTIDLRLKRADTVIYLDFSRRACLWGVIKRRCQHHGKTRPDMTEGCEERLDWKFIKWIWGYRKHTRPETIKLLNEVKADKEVIYLKNRKEVEAFLLGFQS